MSLGSIQICGQKVSALEAQDICKSLESNSIKCLALRECTISDKLYKSLLYSLASCKCILQLNFNLGIVKNCGRLKLLCQALNRNRSLTSLFLHGSPLGVEGTEMLWKTLAVHPNIVALDVGDCKLNDQCLMFIAKLLLPNGAKRGLQDLTLSGNSAISCDAWIKFVIALASSNTLKRLYLDYTDIGDEGAKCLAVALATNKVLEVLDLEGTGITEQGAQVLLHLVQNHPVALKEMVLAENMVKKVTKDAITLSLQENLKRMRMANHLTSTMGSDASSVMSIPESAITDETQSIYSDGATDVSGTMSSLHIADSESENETETIVSIPQTKETFNSAPYIQQVHKHGSNQKQAGFNTADEHNVKASMDSDNDENMGTMLIGETLPGYYANPVRITSYTGRYRQSPFEQGGVDGHMSLGSWGYGAVHPQSATHVAYSDSQ